MDTNAPNSPDSLSRRFLELREKEPSVWQHLRINDEAFWYRTNDGESLKLNSFKSEDLPPLPSPLSFVGRQFIRRSPFARILARRVGKEDVTFYSLINTPHGSGINRWLDQRFLAIGSPPLNWRRDQVIRFIHQQISGVLRSGKRRFTFCDFGCGGGFDSLEIGRQMELFQRETGVAMDFRIVNIDIDELWLGNNARLAGRILEPATQRRITRRCMSIFDYLECEEMRQDLEGTERLIVSCNGFADFFDREHLATLLSGAARTMHRASEGAAMIVPLALRHPSQEWFSKVVGFNYRARTLSDFQRILDDSCPSLAREYEVQHSQAVFYLSTAGGPAKS